jgi:MFS family permease
MDFARPYIVGLFGTVGWAQLFCGLVVLCFVTSALKRSDADGRPRAGSSSSKGAAGAPPKGFASFQRQYIAVMSIIMLADWLQGPYIYDLYTETHKLTEAQYSSLFLSGFLSSAVFGTPVGVLVDTIGRKRGCMLYCLLEVVINLLEHASSFELLLVGRFLGGISTSLLGCAFESWMVSRHKARGYPAQLLDETFTIVSVANGVLAVIGGIISYVLMQPLGLGPIGPFQAAIVLTMIAGALVSSWEENYGEAEAPPSCCPAGHALKALKKAPRDVTASLDCDVCSAAIPLASPRFSCAACDYDVCAKCGGGDAKQAEGNRGGGGLATMLLDGVRSMLGSMSAAAGAMGRDPRLWMLGLVQAFFEGSMFGWVSQWVPALMHLKQDDDKLPIGIIFACLMLCISTGANLFAAAQSRGASVRTLMTLTLLLSFASMLLPFLVPYPPSFTLVLAAFCGFEAACGAFMPGMGVLRAEIIPASMQSTIMTAYRLPLNAVVVLVTQLGKTGVSSSLAGNWKGWEAACAASAIFFGLALGLHLVGSSLVSPKDAAEGAPRGTAAPPPPSSPAMKPTPRRASPKKAPPSSSSRPGRSPAKSPARSPPPSGSTRSRKAKAE